MLHMEHEVVFNKESAEFGAMVRSEMIFMKIDGSYFYLTDRFFDFESNH